MKKIFEDMSLKDKKPLVFFLLIIGVIFFVFWSGNSGLALDRENSFVICNNGAKHNFNHPPLRIHSDATVESMAKGELLLSDEDASRLCGDGDKTNKVTIRTKEGAEYKYLINYVFQIGYK